MNRRLLPAAAVALAALVADVGEAYACSYDRGWLFQPTVYLLATALPDTVAAGPGAVKFVSTPGEVPRGPIYGQVVRVGRTGGELPSELARTDFTEAVLVRWEASAECFTIRWPESARWIKPGARGVVSGRLRDRRQWVGGRPTFDLFYGRGYWYPHRFESAALTADELFDLYSVLPRRDQVWEVEDPYPAIAPFFRWAAAHPKLARRYPVTEALDQAYDEVQRCAGPAGRSPVAGTYRLSLSVPGEPVRTLFFRTTPRSFSAECSDTVVARDPGRFSPRRADSYLLYVRAALHPDSIPKEYVDRWGCDSNWTMQVWDDGRGSGERSWEAELGLGVLHACFGASPGLERAKAALHAAYDAGVPIERGVVRIADGRLVYEHTLRLSGRELWSMRAERISPQVLPF